MRRETSSAFTNGVKAVSQLAGCLAATGLLVPPMQEPPRAYSWLEEGRLHRRSEGATTGWNGLVDAETYCWDDGGRAVIVTRGGRMARVHAGQPHWVGVAVARHPMGRARKPGTRTRV
jgi:hypothetical protein